MEKRRVYIGGFKEFSRNPLPQSGVFIAHDFSGRDREDDPRDAPRQITDYRLAYEDGLREAGFHPVYAPVHSGTILETLVKEMVSTDAGVFDISFGRKYNANVLIELGISIGLNHPTVVVAEEADHPVLELLDTLDIFLYKNDDDLAMRIGDIVKLRIDDFDSRLSPHFCVACKQERCACRKQLPQLEKTYLLIGADDNMSLQRHMRAVAKEFDLHHLDLAPITDHHSSICNWLYNIKRSKFVLFYSQERGKRHHGKESAATMIQLGLAVGASIPWRFVIAENETPPTDVVNYIDVRVAISAETTRSNLRGAIGALKDENNPYHGIYDILRPPEFVEEDTPSIDVDLPRKPKVFMAPPLPANYIPQQELIDGVVQQVIGGAGRTSGTTTILGVMGMGGIGKTTLAAAVCHDERVQQHLVDGVLWVSFGERPEWNSRITGFIRALVDEVELSDGQSAPNMRSLEYRDGQSEYAVLRSMAETGTSRLAALAAWRRYSERKFDYDPENLGEVFSSVEYLSSAFVEVAGNRRYLIVLDDVWSAEHVQPFITPSAKSSYLITTRDASILEQLNASVIRLGLLTKAEAIQLLTADLPVDKDEIEHILPALGELAQRADYHPLTLQLMNGQLRKRIADGQTPAEATHGALEIITQLEELDSPSEEVRNSTTGYNRDTTLNQYANIFIDAIQPANSEIEYARQEVNTLRQRLQQVFSGVEELANIIRDIEVFGSFARNTAVTPLSDLDVLVVFRIDPQQQVSNTVYEILETGLSKAYGKNVSKISKPQNSFSSSIIVKRQSIILDVVPAAVDHDKQIVVPNQRKRGWVPTNHLLHEQYSRRQDEMSDGLYTRVIRLFKWWKQINVPSREYLITGFTLECLIAQAFERHGVGDNILHEFGAIIQTIDSDLKRSKGLVYVPEIGSSGRRKSTGLTQQTFSRFTNIIGQTSQLTKRAIGSENIDQELLIWRRIFGDKFPTKL